MVLQIQYVSDLHLEHYDKKNEGYIIPSMFLKPSAPYLALCGDIGNPDLLAYEAFLAWCSKSYTLVFLIAGNHEYYNYRSSTKSDMAARKEMIRKLTANLKNLFFLDCSSYYIAEHNVRVLGCTLWSDTSTGSEEKIITYMNDARSILAEGDEHLIPRRMTALHFQEKAWLDNQIALAKGRGEDVLILTHYLPSFQLIHEKYKDNPLNMCFASDCEDLLRDPVKAWICGHSHTGVRIDIKGVKCLMNPYGYPGERVETRQSSAVLALETKEKRVDA
jgi:predicted phosphohydrolase